jgi:hypothetical protein
MNSTEPDLLGDFTREKLPTHTSVGETATFRLAGEITLSTLLGETTNFRLDAEETPISNLLGRYGIFDTEHLSTRRTLAFTI